MKKIYTLVLLVFLFAEIQDVFSQNILIQENFTNYLGTSATVPAGWYFSYNGNYTSSTFSGTSGPNSYKFGVTGATIITPSFTNADTVSFWIKGSSTDTASYLSVFETPDSSTWTSIAVIKPIPTSGTAFQYLTKSTSIHLKFVYTKSAGNVAFDDFLLKGASAPPPPSNNPYITVYFTQPVDTTYSSGTNATYLNNIVFDTLAAYINRAKYSIDICQYEYKTYTGDPIYTAINNAYSRGVKIRYIQDGGYAPTNTGVAALNASIPVIASPTSSSYNICHNKFVIIDEHDSLHAVVWTGSPDWDLAMSKGDYNNVIIFQSEQLAKAFTHEFNIMWGDTTHGGTSNASTRLFGPFKPNSGNHKFTIGGDLVELYFSPSDSVNNQIVKAITSANFDLYCGMFTFTDNNDATDIVSQKNYGAYAAAILDGFSSSSYTPYTTTLPNGLGNNFTGYSSGTYLYHNKYLIVNPSAPCNDPKVLTGSHNWTSSADTKNDENTVIVHNAIVANMYLQSFAKDFSTIGTHALAHLPDPCNPTGTNSLSNEEEINIFPNPSEGKFNLSISQSANLKIYNLFGECMYHQIATSPNFQVDLSSQPSGIYFVKIQNDKKSFTRKIIINH